MNLLKHMKRLSGNGLIYLLLVISFHSYALPATNAVAPNSALGGVNTFTATFEELGWKNSITLNGYKPEHNIYLPIAKYTNPQKIILHLKANFSPKLNTETRLDIKLNQTILRRISLPADPTKEFNLDVELPLSELTADWQVLDFMVYLSGSKNLCDPNLWVYISPDSSVTVTTMNSLFSGTLDQLPGLFINPISFNPVAPVLVLPPQSTQQEIFAALNLAFYLGTLAENSQVNLNTKSIDALTAEEKNHNLILVSTTEHLKLTPLGVSLLDDPTIKNRQNPNAGLLKLAPSPFNPVYGLLTISGDNDKALNQAITAFTLPVFKQMTFGQVAVVDEAKIGEQQKSKADWFQTTLQELGYQDQSVSGLGQSKVIYDIPLPNNLIPANSTVRTYITSPNFTPEDNSQIILLVNGLKQSSFALTQDHSTWKVDINADALKPGINTLEYQVNLHLKNESCSLKDIDEVWTTIYAQTEFNTLFFSEFPRASLNQFPIPFSEEITLIVPDKLSAQDVSDITALMFTFGRLMQSQMTPVTVVNSSAVNEEYIRSHNIILYGTPQQNRWINFAFEYLPFALLNDNERRLALPQKNLILSGQDSTGLLELVSSPWCSKKAVFLISGVDETSLSQAIDAFTNDSSRIKLEGNIALINADKTVHAINSDDAQYISLRTQVQLYLTNTAKNMWFYVKYHPQIFIILLVFIVPLYIYLRRRKRKK